MSISVPQQGGLLDASGGPHRELAPSELVPGTRRLGTEALRSKEEVLKGNTHSSIVVLAISTLRVFSFYIVGLWGRCAFSDEIMLPRSCLVAGPLRAEIECFLCIC